MKSYRIKEVQLSSNNNIFYPQYKDDDCAGYFNPTDPDAVNGLTEWQTFYFWKNNHMELRSYTNIVDAINFIKEHFIESSNLTIGVVYHPVDPTK